MPGVQLARDGDAKLDAPSQDDAIDEPDWFQMADDALANADLEDSDLLPVTPELIIIDDDDDNDIAYPQLIPKVEPAPTSSSMRQTTSRYPQRVCASLPQVYRIFISSPQWRRIFTILVIPTRMPITNSSIWQYRMNSRWPKYATMLCYTPPTPNS